MGGGRGDNGVWEGDTLQAAPCRRAMHLIEADGVDHEGEVKRQNGYISNHGEDH
jgi:hypothetical protein